MKCGDRLHREPRPTITIGQSYRIDLEVPRYGFSVPVRIDFPTKTPFHPRVVLPEDWSSPHRYEDPTHACIWYDEDPAKQKWVFRDGLHQMLLHITWHLYREVVYHETGEWLGDQAPHAPLERMRR